MFLGLLIGNKAFLSYVIGLILFLHHVTTLVV